MRLELALDAVVGEGIVSLFDAEKLLQLGIWKNFSLILGVLEVVVLDVGANVLCDIDSRLEIGGSAPDELRHLL